ncbi:phage pi2 protein 07 [Paenibacillus shirakamiensis]|uniref:Phage pi2 protein 07 n=1 Tax=Paenibacillus shirakamiensis TaxID=1265935 RepID=A0ABS4JDD0_9BACL|nr:group-specific protein [Paenibacillus shirakamiensis]MBP1999718.1 phage pi2 protein 07 [Paenibacillus shirakamiensis]
MSSLISISLDESKVLEICKEKLNQMLHELDSNYVFWDTAELKHRTCMSWNFIQEQFFYDPRFPKRKIGAKWYFPARETREFLENWLREQNAN